jgi:arylsulfatase A-like enzyme
MEVDIHKVPLREVQDLRELFLRENSFQFVHDKCHGAGWADTYLFSIGKEAAGYGSVWGKDDRKDRDTIFEFYLLGPYLKFAPVIFPSFIIASGAPYMECQTNDRGLADMMFANARNIYAEAILFEDAFATEFVIPHTLFRKNNEDTEYLLEHEGEIVATGGYVWNYNFPYIDMYYEVKEGHRKKGFGSLITQELKREAYRLKRVPAARCNVKNNASKSTLLKAGMRVCGHLLYGELGMKGFLFAILLLFVGIFSSSGQGQNGSAAAGRPNIIFILSDDHAYQAISAYGSQLAQTPNIDRIAKEGALFTRMMVTNSICGPSRACLLTGKYSHKNGYTVNEGRFNTSQPVFTDLMRNNGYQTAWIGKWHLGNLPRGFDYFNILNGQGEYYNPDLIGPTDTIRMEGYVTDIITGLVEKWLDGRDGSKPWCLIVGEKATHREWLPDIQDLGAYDDKDFPLPPTFHDDYKGRRAAADQDMTISKTMILKADLKVHADYEHSGIYNRFTPAQKKPFYDYYENKISREFDLRKDTGEALVRWKYERYVKDYLSVARSLDRNIGRLLDYLDEKGLAKNTVVIYASDQGFWMGEHGWFDKRWIYEESLRTPFVVRYPGVIRPGTTVSDITLNIDWGPTILDMAGIRASPDMQGVSFLPLVDGRGAAAGHGAARPEVKATWRKAMYYHYYEYPQPHHVSPHFGIRTEHWVLVRFYGPGDFWELYNLDKDPEELNNLYGQAGYGEMEKKLKIQLKGLIRHYEDNTALQIMEKGGD